MLSITQLLVCCVCYLFISWKPNTWVELQNVRFPPSPPDVELNLATGAKIEVILLYLNKRCV